MKAKATAAGSCQACGRVQKLPNDLLALHGYSVRWNTFIGQCPGSKHEPYEQSCALIKRFIASAKESRKPFRRASMNSTSLPRNPRHGSLNTFRRHGRIGTHVTRIGKSHCSPKPRNL